MDLTKEQRCTLKHMIPRGLKLRHDESTVETVWWDYFWEWKHQVMDGRRVRDQQRMDEFLKLNQELLAADALTPT